MDHFDRIGRNGIRSQLPTAESGFLPTLSLPHGWSFDSMSPEEVANHIEIIEVSNGSDLPFLDGVLHHYVIRSVPCSSARTPMKRKGWQGPGPGPKRGLPRIPSFHDVYGPILLAVIHLAKEAVHFQQLYSFDTNLQDGDSLDFLSTMSLLTSMENDLPVSKAMKKCVWPLTHQIGVPGFLIKLKSPHHAIVLHFTPDIAGYNWVCSICRGVELSLIRRCSHSDTVRSCIEEISQKLGCTVDYLMCSMTQSAAFNHITELNSTGFYGFKNKMDFAVVRKVMSSTINTTSPMTSGGSIHIVRHLPSTRRWKCMDNLCSGITKSCIHQQSVEHHLQVGVEHLFSSIHELVGADDITYTSHESNFETESSDIPIPRYGRPMIPSENAFLIDEGVNRDARNHTTQILRASEICHCGRSVFHEQSSDISVANIRVESMRTFVNYKQEIWYCSNGHRVTPEESHDTREGILWVSKHTAFTEVFLFEMLLHMTLAGGTISMQADLRSQILFLQTNYMNASDHPRGALTVRKALITYAMAVVKSIPPWVFRCTKCSITHKGKPYYEKLSFDGQQLGFNIRKDVRYDFYGKASNPWRRPIDRCPEASKLAMMVESKHLRFIILEALRVRDVPSGCNAVQTLCKTMMNIALRSRETIRAAIAAIKLFDSNWVTHMPVGILPTDDTSFHAFHATDKPDLAVHPLQYITDVNNALDFERGMRVVHVFRDVLDSTPAAYVICMLIQDLRSDLKAHIPHQDLSFMRSYNILSQAFLNSWLSHLSSSEESWLNSLPSTNLQDINESLPSGIAEHTNSLNHPFRPPFGWMNLTDTNSSHKWPGRKLTIVRPIEEWVAPEDAQIVILLFFMAALSESVIVWVRDGSLDTVQRAEEVLQNAENHCGQLNMEYHLRDDLRAISNIILLYEGVMGLIGANNTSARPMFSTCRKLLESMRERFKTYLASMSSFKSRKSFMCTPKEFDDMLLWTEAFKDVEAGPENTAHTLQMRSLYEKLAKERSNDFLETGIWAPDFPIQRPSPSSTTWANNVHISETSCSKNFNTHSAFSPGTFGGYCLCRHAKTIMVSFLKRPEGCRMPLNLIVERCSTLPKYVVYDFACGTQRAATALSAEISKHVRFVIDPFHFPGHKTCTLAMHQANYPDLKWLNVESQEQRNSRIKIMERTLRASRDIHFMHFVVLAHGYLNLKATYLDHHDLSDDGDIGTKAWLKWVRENLF